MARGSAHLDKDIARLKREAVDPIDRDLRAAIADVAAIKAYLSGPLYNWLVEVEAVVATGTGPPRPSF